MFLGHFAVALAAKKFAPKSSLGTLVLSSQWVDLIWPLFLLIGIERVRIDPGNTALTPLDFYAYPFTHSLLMSFTWSLLVGGIYFALKRNRSAAVVVALCVFSHWVLDFITHRPDLPLAFGSGVYFGLGLWNSVAGTVILEVALFAAGIIVYLRTTTANDRMGTFGFWALIGVLLLIYVANVFGPPPPNETMIAIVGNTGWLFVWWGWLADRHRSKRQTQHWPNIGTKRNY